MHTLLNRLFMIAGLIFVSGLVAIAQDTAAPSEFPIYAATDVDGIRAKEGQKVMVWGETTGSGKSSSGMNFVNFKDTEFYLVTFKTDLKPFGDAEPADAYDGKRIVVTGVISIYKDKVQIKLTSPDQVKILADDEAWPKAAPKAETAAPTSVPRATGTPSASRSINAAAKGASA